jgi:hypothetical protein
VSAPVDVGTEVAALHFYLATAKHRDDDVSAMLSGIPQCRDGALATMADDAWLWTLNQQRNDDMIAAAMLAAGTTEPCPDCRAAAGESCHVDCSSRWNDGL